ncbi:MAG: YraN family protein [Cyanobacteriota bacterium]|nr:YraN family protein [Cyanobacteriota bacterium]
MVKPLTTVDLGTLGETLVANWLIAQGWQLQDRQWHCTWGELDLVMVRAMADTPRQLAFVEVKTRSQGNWDADGLMAITRHKQTKLAKAAQLYLLRHRQWAEAICRFDVALVTCRRGPFPAHQAERHLDLGNGRYLALQDYIDAAFDAPHP